MENQSQRVQEDVEKFAGNVRRLRKYRVMSQQALADALTERGHKTDAVQVLRMEKGISGMSLARAISFASFFGYTVDEMLSSLNLDCRHCDGKPPVGFTCSLCGQSSEGGA
ncbi:helix-turn-helix transcriptional regulator [Amycolatopsis palatopharyngis]|uniref:helix-turn-helix transcriptional regulator n=1 Tax=Amycolatopsis palatopharyngis TaxID=187982 RepID=UPI000E2491D5|nr:helix-turn-helix transcriptional regulator [Amycolatopsis palatopharyngis]